mgnify:CR=1 FL=1
MNSLNDIWNSVLAVLGQNLTATALNTWFDDCTPVEIVNNRLVIHTPTEFKRDIIQSRFAQTIIDALSDLFSAEFKLTILAGDELDSYISETKTDDTLPEVAGFTFDNFVVGPSNKYAHAAAIAVAENPGKLYNPLFIYGNSGLGKTHLLLAIGSAIHAKNPKAKIVYVKGDDFTNDLVHAIQVGGGEDLRAKYRSADLLLMDDIQFIAGKQQTQEEFFHTFNALYESGKQIVLTSDRPPKEMTQLEDRLRTRFEWGLMVDVEPPDYETRLAIIRNKAALLGINLPDRISSMIAENITANVRQIEGVLNKILAYSDLMGVMDEEAIMKALEDVVKNSNEYIPTPESIIDYISKYFGIEPDVLQGQGRGRDITNARQIAMYLIRRMTNLSLKDIGKAFGNRDHSTVMHSLDKVETQMRSDPAFAETVKEITTNINAKQ